MAEKTPPLRDLLARAVEEKGADYVYPEAEKAQYLIIGDPVCSYFYEGKPSCIIGHVLSYLGRTKASEGSNASTVLRGFGFTLGELAAAQSAQGAQDQGGTWGGALAVFDREMR